MDPETGECIFGQKIQQVARREKGKLTYALQNPEYPGHTRGKGVVVWKYGFRDYIDTYRSRNRRKNEE